MCKISFGGMKATDQVFLIKSSYPMVEKYSSMDTQATASSVKSLYIQPE